MTRERPLAAWWVAGALIVCAGTALAVLGLKDAFEAASAPDPFSGTGAQELADAVSRFTWGVMIFTIGCYAWRAARRRGVRDRSGRLLIAIGYVLLGMALDRIIHTAVGIWSVSDEEQGSSVLLHVVVNFLGWGIPAAFLIWLGVKRADEKVLVTVDVKVNG